MQGSRKCSAGEKEEKIPEWDGMHLNDDRQRLTRGRARENRSDWDWASLVLFMSSFYIDVLFPGAYTNPTVKNMVQLT